MSTFASCIHFNFFIYPHGDRHAKKSFNLSSLRVQMSYHIFNNLSELLNGYLAAKIGQGIIYIDFMDIQCTPV